MVFLWLLGIFLGYSRPTKKDIFYAGSGNKQHACGAPDKQKSVK
ncbi:hypothetical protein [Domibacillus indicus]|nr:hypothetical protein [Domibacillus indicus]